MCGSVSFNWPLYAAPRKNFTLKKVSLHTGKCLGTKKVSRRRKLLTGDQEFKNLSSINQASNFPGFPSSEFNDQYLARWPHKSVSIKGSFCLCHFYAPVSNQKPRKYDHKKLLSRLKPSECSKSRKRLRAKTNQNAPTANETLLSLVVKFASNNQSLAQGVWVRFWIFS